MVQPISFKVSGHVAEIVLNAPPANALKPPVRHALVEAIGRVEQDRSIRALIIRAKGKMFSAGGDIREAENEAEPTLRHICNRIENLPVPVIAGIQGTALGGGAELALAAHFRLFAQEAQIGFPDVTLGLVPSAGASQRLPRIVGAEASLKLLLEARTISAETARELKLANGIVKGAMKQACRHLAEMLIEKEVTAVPAKDRREMMIDGTAYLNAVRSKRAALEKSPLEAPKRIVDCVEAALLVPFDVANEIEAAAREETAKSDQSRALRHMFIAERRISPTLLSRGENGRRLPGLEVGTEVLDRLRHVLRAAINHAAAQGAPYAKIDGALLSLGFGKGPFEAEKPIKAGKDVEMLRRRFVAGLMAEGARMVEAGLVERASDIDALAVHGMGFPRWRGGPMKAAHLMGLISLRNDMRKWQQESRIWDVPQMLDEAVKYSGGFDALLRLEAET